MASRDSRRTQSRSRTPRPAPTPLPQSELTRELSAVPIPELVVPIVDLAFASAEPPLGDDEPETVEVPSIAEMLDPEEWVLVWPHTAGDAYQLCRPITGWKQFAVRETATGLLVGSVHRTLEHGEQALAAAISGAERSQP